MKVSKIFSHIFVALVCIAGVSGCANVSGKHQANVDILKEYAAKYHAKGGAYIVLDAATGQEVDKQFVELPEDFLIWSNNALQLFNYAVGMHNETVKDEEKIVFNTDDQSLNKRIDKAEREEFLKAYATNGYATTLNLVSAYAKIFQNADGYLTDLQLARLKSAVLENVQSGKAKTANVEGANVSGFGSTTKKEKDGKEVYTVFVGEFEKDGKVYAIITLLDEPQPLKSTYGFNTAGWNAVPMAREIIKNTTKK